MRSTEKIETLLWGSAGRLTPTLFVVGAACPHLPVVVHTHPAVLSSPARGGGEVTPCLPGQRRYNTVREYLSYCTSST